MQCKESKHNDTIDFCNAPLPYEIHTYVALAVACYYVNIPYSSIQNMNYHFISFLQMHLNYYVRYYSHTVNSGRFWYNLV